MANKGNIPQPPPGFEPVESQAALGGALSAPPSPPPGFEPIEASTGIISGSSPTPPPGFEPVGQVPAPPPGFEPVEPALSQRETRVFDSIAAGMQGFVLPTMSRALNRIGVSSKDIPAANTPLKLLKRGLQLAESPELGPTPGFVPTTPAEQIIAGATSFLDPSVLALGGVSGDALAAAAGKLGLTAKAGQLTKLLKVAKGGELMGIDSAAQAIPGINRRILVNTFQQKAAEGAGAGAGTALAVSGAKQLESGEFKPEELAAETALGATVGAVFSGAPALRKAKAPVVTASGSTINPTLVDFAKREADKSAQALVDRGVIPEQLKQITAQKHFLERLESHGIRQSDIAAPLSKFDINFVNGVEVADKIDRSFGTRVTESMYRLMTGENRYADVKNRILDSVGSAVSSLQKLKVNKHEITNLMQYVESTPGGGVQFNPNAKQLSETFSRPEFRGVAPDEAVLQELGKIRQVFDAILAENPSFAHAMGYIEGYIPLLRKRTGLRAVDVKPGSTTQIEEAFFMKPRESSSFDPNIHETDFTKIVRFYANAAGKHVGFDEHLPQLYGEITKLRWMGRASEAELLAQKAMRAMGLRNKVELSRAFGDRIAESSQNIINEIAKDSLAPAKFTDEVLNTIRRMTYNGLVFTNPKTIIQQSIQPETMAGGEIGLKYLAKGRAKMLSKEGKALAKNFMPIMKAQDAGNFAELAYEPTTNRFLRFIERASDIGAVPGKAAFDKFEKVNRAAAFLGAREQFVAEARTNLANVMDGLLAGEKAIVEKALKKDGFEAAANTYGIIRSRRINFHYGLADVPEAFAEGLGRMIPFTAWSRNQFSRLVGDVQNKNYKAMAKRIAVPLVGMTAFKMVTGYDIPGALPFAASADVLRTQAYPVLAQFTEAVSKSKDMKSAGAAGLKAALPLVPIAGPIERVRGKLQKGKDPVEALLGFRKLEKDDAAMKLRKAILKGLK